MDLHLRLPVAAGMRVCICVQARARARARARQRDSHSTDTLNVSDDIIERAKVWPEIFEPTSFTIQIGITLALCLLPSRVGRTLYTQNTGQVSDMGNSSTSGFC